MQINRFIYGFIGFIFSSQAITQPLVQQISYPIAPVWKEEVWITLESGLKLLYFDFDGSIRWANEAAFPAATIHQVLDGACTVNVTLENDVWEPWPANLPFDPIFSMIPQDPILSAIVSIERNQYFLNGQIMPLRMRGQRLERLVSGTMLFQLQSQPIANMRGDQTEESVLTNGTVYKLGVTQEGLYKLTYDFLKNTVKMPIDQIDPRRIQLYGNGGGMLPRLNSAFRHDDLAENAIYIHGESDGVFHPGDYILFYAPGPNPVRYQDQNGTMTRETNIFDLTSYLFLKAGQEDGLRIAEIGSEDPTGSTEVNFYTQVYRIEDELTNLLDEFPSGQGSGQRWYGDKFSISVKSYDYTQRFNMPEILPGSTVRVDAAFASRSDVQNRFGLTLNSRKFETGNISNTDLGRIDARYALTGFISTSFVPTGGMIFPIQVTYTANSPNSTGWLDYIELEVKHPMIYKGPWLRMTTIPEQGVSRRTWKIENSPPGLQIWDITDPIKISRQAYTRNGTLAQFTGAGDLRRTFLLWDNDQVLPLPSFAGVVPNQNLHGHLEADMLIVYHPEFTESVMRLAEHRRTYSGLKVITATVDEIYNEFSCGSKDPYAIRDFARMLYQRDANFKYLLLFGDASFDTRNIKGLKKSGDYVPVFESPESLDPINAYPTDDLFGVLDDNEGGQFTGQGIDIAIGRLPVETKKEAEDVVNKIIRYDVAPEAFGDWRLRMLFMGDDEDNSLHMRQADELATNVWNWQSSVNIEKVYLDAFKQIATPGGQRYPDATKAIDNAMFQGTLVVNFLGHGGPTGWTQERVVQIENIQRWSNLYRMPMILTATCTFAAFDDPGFKSGGEVALLNPIGGAIALISTVRPVYASLNKELAGVILEEMFQSGEPWAQPMGELLRRGKNRRNNSTNERKFLLLGDPAQFLAYPKLRVVATEINEIPIQPGSTDPVTTIKAMQTVTVKGQIETQSGELVSDFNGLVFPTVYDKVVRRKTLGNDGGSPVIEFDLQNSILFKGAATATNGHFEFTFTLPQNINYTVGLGKISFYAWDNSIRDAAGDFQYFYIGGYDDTVIPDELPPIVDVYMNGPDWESGGLTTDRPVLYVELSDDSGFNISGNSIGQDAIAILNENSYETFVLNSFYDPMPNDSRKGTIRYPLGTLEPGVYTIMVRAWDIFNNPGEGFTKFTVGRTDKGIIEDLTNFPNPFSDYTWFRFEHNLAGNTVRLRISIHDYLGRSVRVLESDLFADSNRISTLGWDGRGNNGMLLPNGLYFYQVMMEVIEGPRLLQSAESATGKLVLLK